jgi:undecaprenyl diphosphate synthase
MKQLLKKINFQKIPKHVAIIMDGNGRWAKKRGLLRTLGHANANQSIKETLYISKYLGISFVTLYVFSSENWKRPNEEIMILHDILYTNLEKEFINFQKKDIKILTIGNIKKFPAKIQCTLNNIIIATKNNKSITLILALNYGSQNEIIRATKIISKKVVKGLIDVEKINNLIFENHLYTKNIPHVDLLIRTSGEQRISNFLLWQSAYAEFYFTKVLWPDFRKKDFLKAIINYQKRQRRFGKI